MPSDHWANSDYVDVLLTCGERGLGSFGELVLFQGMDVEFRGKKCTEVKYQQDYIPRI